MTIFWHRNYIERFSEAVVASNTLIFAPRYLGQINHNTNLCWIILIFLVIEAFPDNYSTTKIKHGTSWFYLIVLFYDFTGNKFMLFCVLRTICRAEYFWRNGIFHLNPVSFEHGPILSNSLKDFLCFTGKCLQNK